MTTKRIRTSDILGSNYYIYELSSSNYTPALNGTITITCNCKNVYGDNIANKTLTLYQNGTSKGTQTTNNNGVATWSVTCSTAGLQKFSVGNESIEVLIGEINSDSSSNNEVRLIEPNNDNEINFNEYTETGTYLCLNFNSNTTFINAPYGEIYARTYPLIILNVEDISTTLDYGNDETEDFQLIKQTFTILDNSNYIYNVYSREFMPNNNVYSSPWRPLSDTVQLIDPTTQYVNLDYWIDTGQYLYHPPNDTSNMSYSNFPSGMTKDDSFILIVQSYNSITYQILFTIPTYQNHSVKMYTRVIYDNWTEIGAVDIDTDKITLSASKQKLNENESFKIYANVKDEDGNAVANKSLTLIQKRDSYSNPDMSATGWVRDATFYVDDMIFKGDWYCKFEYNGSDKNHSGLLLYTTSSEFITFDTLGVESLIEIFCTNNNITIKVDGVLPDSVYTTQPSSGTKVGFFCHEDYSVSVKNFVANGELYKEIGTSTTDSNGNCSWNFSNGLSKGLYPFYINNNHIDIFVGLFVNEESIQHIGSFYDLQQLISNAASGDTIILDKDYKSNPDDYYYIVLNKSLTIIGNGHTIDQNEQYYTDMPEASYPALYINSSNVIIKDINFINADTGAIQIYNNNTTIENCNFINCQSKYITDNASGIHNVGNVIPTIKNCSFINCSDTDGRGGIYSDSPITVEDCTFYNSSTYRVTNKKSIYNTPNKNYIEDQIYYLTYQENHLNTDHDHNDNAFSQTVTGDFKIKTKTSEGFSGSITIYQPSYNFDVTLGFGDDGMVLSSDLTGDERIWNTTYYDNSEECDIEIWYEYDKTGIFLCGEKIDIKVYIKINESIISFLSDYTVDMGTIYAASNNIPYLNVVKEFDVSIGIDNGEFIDFSLFNGKKINDHTHSTEPIQHTHMVSQIPNVEPVELLVTYSDNTTDMLTLLKKTYEYYDKALNDNANYYVSVFGITDQINWDSNEYLITYAENGYHDAFDLIALPNISLENNMKISIDIKLLGGSYMYNGMIGFYEPGQEIMFGGWAQGEKYYRLCEFENIDGDILQTTPNDQWSYLSINDYNHHELIYKNETVTYTITNPSGVSKTLTMNLRNVFLGSSIGILVECFGTNACYVKNIKVERI